MCRCQISRRLLRKNFRQTKSKKFLFYTPKTIFYPLRSFLSAEIPFLLLDKHEALLYWPSLRKRQTSFDVSVKQSENVEVAWTKEKSPFRISHSRLADRPQKERLRPVGNRIMRPIDRAEQSWRSFPPRHCEPTERPLWSNSTSPYYAEKVNEPSFVSTYLFPQTRSDM